MTTWQKFWYAGQERKSLLRKSKISRKIIVELHKSNSNLLEVQRWIKKSNVKSRNPTSNPEIQRQIQKSNEKSRKSNVKSWNPREIKKSDWNPEIHSEIQKLNPTKSDWFRNLVRSPGKCRTPRSWDETTTTSMCTLLLGQAKSADYSYSELS